MLMAVPGQTAVFDIGVPGPSGKHVRISPRPPATCETELRRSLQARHGRRGAVPCFDFP